MNVFFKISLLFALILSSSFVFAMGSKVKEMNEEDCLSDSLIKDITNDIKIIADSDLNLELDLEKISACDKDDVTNRIIRGLAFLKYGQFNTSKKSDDEEFYNDFEKISPYDFLKKRIKNIKLTNARSCNINYIIAFAFRNDETFYFCFENFKKYHKKEITAGSFANHALHEARHVDNDDSRHVTCEHGLGKGMERGCDRNRAQLGAYHYGTEYSVYIAKFGKNFHPAVKNKARADALLGLMNKFNEVPKINTARLAVLRDANDNSMLTVSESKETTNLNVKINGHLYPRSDGAFSIFNNNFFSSWQIYNSTFDAALGSYANEYNKTNFQHKFNDIIYGKGNEAYISAISYDNYLKYSKSDSKDDSDKTIPLPLNNFKRFLNPSNCGGKNDRIYLLSDDQTVLEGVVDENDEISFKKNSNCAVDFLNIAQLGQSKLGLTTDGRLLELIGNKWKPVKETESKRYNFLSDSFDLYTFFLKSE